MPRPMACAMPRPMACATPCSARCAMPSDGLHDATRRNARCNRGAAMVGTSFRGTFSDLCTVFLRKPALRGTFSDLCTIFCYKSGLRGAFLDLCTAKSPSDHAFGRIRAMKRAKTQLEPCIRRDLRHEGDDAALHAATKRTAQPCTPPRRRPRSGMEHRSVNPLPRYSATDG